MQLVNCAAVAPAVERKRVIHPRKEWVLIRKLIRGEEVLEDGIIRKAESGKEVTAGSVIIPEAKDDRSQRGEVVAVSASVTDLKVGDMVIFTNYPNELPDIEELTGDKNLCLVREEEVFAVVV